MFICTRYDLGEIRITCGLSPTGMSGFNQSVIGNPIKSNHHRILKAGLVDEQTFRIQKTWVMTMPMMAMAASMISTRIRGSSSATDYKGIEY